MTGYFCCKACGQEYNSSIEAEECEIMDIQGEEQGND